MRLRHYFIGAAILFAVILALAAFVIGDPNPFAWTQNDRGGVVFAWVSILFIYLIIEARL